MTPADFEWCKWVADMDGHSTHARVAMRVLIEEVERLRTELYKEDKNVDRTNET